MTLPRSSVIVVSAQLTGCIHAVEIEAYGDEVPYTCDGRPAPTPMVHPQVTTSPRLLAVSRRGDPVPDWSAWKALTAVPAVPAAPGPSPWGGGAPVEAAPAAPVGSGDPVADWFQGRAEGFRLQIAADTAPMSSLAVALSSASGLDVAVQPEISGVPVTLSLTEITLDGLLRLLQEDYSVYAIFDDGVLRVSNYEGYLERRYTPELAPLEAVLVPVPHGASAAQVAAGWCTWYATPRGSAAVLGEQVMFRDTSVSIQAARALLETVRQTAPVEDDE